MRSLLAGPFFATDSQAKAMTTTATGIINTLMRCCIIA